MTLEEIRTRIDEVDAGIRELFIQRMQLADEVAVVKAQTEDTIYKPAREAAVIEKQSKNMDQNLLMEYRALIRRIMEVSRKYQYGRTLQLRDCFPFSYETQLPEFRTMGVMRQELFLTEAVTDPDCLMTLLKKSGGQIHSFRTLEEVEERISDGRLDAGMGIIERIGSGVQDSLNAGLLRRGYYINDCTVLRDGEEKLKVVAFSGHLVILPQHNRLKIVFIAPNRSGALGSILSMIADYGVNMTEIHSIPFREGDDWNYRFFVELQLNLLEQTAQALIFQLSQETQQMQILGSYRCVGDFADHE